MSSDPATRGQRRTIRIGKYEVLSHIATGGMGAVYKARDTETDKEVALKVLSPEMAAKPSMVERFRREAKHAAKLRHENVVTLYEFGEAQHTYFLVMEFVDGIDLFDYSRSKGPLDPKEALDIVLQSCRGIDHAFREGVIHRDIKPSNFLLARQGERMVVKLTDFGLAREASNEEFRVTRAGTTIGTLDYMSPEQARDSGLADVRSDLYSLGCTWYHLLTGHAPFPKGGLGERLHRIMNEEPPDVRKFNRRVSAAMATVVHRLMAKEPSRRYQTPADLLRELEALQRGEPVLTPRQALENLANEAAEPVEPPRSKTKIPRPPSGERRKPRSSPARSRADTKTSKSTVEVPNVDSPATTPVYLWVLIAGSIAIILAVALAVALSPRRGHRGSPKIEQVQNPVAQTVHPESGDNQTGKPDPSPPPPVIPVQKPDAAKKSAASAPEAVSSKKASWPALYRPSTPIAATALRQEIEAPWATAPPQGPTVELTVGRLSPDPSGKSYRSLAAACKAIPEGGTGIIELRDNGPFFDVPIVLAGRSLVLRAGKGYSPLLVWDVQRTLDERRRSSDRREPAPPGPLVFVDVQHGNLTLQDLHLALKWPEAPSEGASVLRVEDGDLTVRGCTFSVSGKPRDGLTLAQFRATKPEAGRCRFERCYARGTKMTVLDANAPGAQMLFDRCLLVGDDSPLLRLQIANDRSTRLRAVRSTMICGTNLLELRAADPLDYNPAFDWLGWDLLLSRNNRDSGGELLKLIGNMNSRHLRWRAINCMYAGWSNLAAGATTIAASDLAAWQSLWNNPEGEGIQPDPWPRSLLSEPAEAPASTYRTAGSPVAFAASTDPNQPLGCDLDGLPSVRDDWLALTVDRYTILAPPVPDDAEPPAIPDAADGLFHGATVDLNQTDLGIYLQDMQRRFRLAPEVVLRLSGNGKRFTRPLRIKGSNLVLYFEPPPPEPEKEADPVRDPQRTRGANALPGVVDPLRKPEGKLKEKPAPPKKEPLVLVPHGRSPCEALIEVEQGNLSIVNGNLGFADAIEGRVLPWLIKVRRGDLRLYRTHLQVPPRDSGSAFRGLIALQGSGDPAADRVYSCLVNETILASARDAIAIEGIGARVLLTQTLVIAGGDAIRLALDPDFSRKASGPTAGKVNVQCLLDRTTVSARGGVVHLPDVQRVGPSIEPVIVQSRDCGFVNLFPGRSARPSLVRYEREALAHGLLIWQSESDTFDRRWWFGTVDTASPLPDKPENHASWLALWGSPGWRRPKLDALLFPRTLDGDRWSLDQRLPGSKLPGVNLDKLGLVHKPPAKSK